MGSTSLDNNIQICSQNEIAVTMNTLNTVPENEQAVTIDVLNIVPDNATAGAIGSLHIAPENAVAVTIGSLNTVLETDALWVRGGEKEIDVYLNTEVKPEMDAYAQNLEAGFDENAEDKTAEFNQNAISKTNEFNENAVTKAAEFNTNADNKTIAFNQNASAKTTEFDENASAQISAFNSNASTKTSAFDTNASNQQSAFDGHVDDKISEFDTNATSKTNDFNANANEKQSLFDTNTEKKTNSFNNNSESKTSAFNENATNKTTKFNNNANSKQVLIDAAVSDAEAAATSANTSKDLAQTSANAAAASAQEAKEAVASLGAVYRAKGSVDTYSALPTTDNITGDVWNVLDTDDNYVWTDTGVWDKLSATVDLTPYLKKAEASQTYATQNQLTNYLPLTGGTITGDITFEPNINIKFNAQPNNPNPHYVLTYVDDNSNNGLAYSSCSSLPISTAVQAALDNKANASDLSTVATTGDYNDLSNIPNPYTLPTASTTTLGGVKVDGSSVTINNGVISSTAGTVDSELSDTSLNAIQNKVVTGALNNKVESSTFNTSDSQNVKLTGEQKISGMKTFKNSVKTEDGYIYIKNNNIDSFVVPSSASYGQGIIYKDTNEYSIGYISPVSDTSGNITNRFGTQRRKSDGSYVYADLKVTISKDFTISTYAPNPATSSNTTNIATTYWVNSTQMPDYSLAATRTSGTSYTESKNGVLVAHVNNTGTQGGWSITIDGKTFNFWQGYSGTDYNHPTNGFFMIPKGVSYKATNQQGSSVTFYFVPYIGG